MLKVTRLERISLGLEPEFLENMHWPHQPQHQLDSPSSPQDTERAWSLSLRWPNDLRCQSLGTRLGFPAGLPCPSFSFFFTATHAASGISQAPSVKLDLQLPAYATATAKWDPSRVCKLHHGLQQHQILNPLSDVRDQTCILMDTSRILNHNGNSPLVHLQPAQTELRFDTSLGMQGPTPWNLGTDNHKSR